MVFNPTAIASKADGIGAGYRAELLSGSSQTPDLPALLEGLRKKYSRMQGISAEFVQTYIGNDGRVLKEAGRVLLKRPRKARWDYTTPERKVFLADGKSIYFYVYGEREATRASIKGSVDPQIPFLFLLSSINLNKEFSRIEIASSQTPVFKDDLMLHLVPKRAPEEFKSLYAEVNPKSMEVRRLLVGERNGTTMDFLLTNVRENSVAPDSEFVFSAPPGVAVRRADSQ
ncbi:MAG: outer membrane lipoprotein chaperone LolA [Blastocatellia bacterium]